MDIYNPDDHIAQRGNYKLISVEEHHLLKRRQEIEPIIGYETASMHEPLSLEGRDALLDTCRPVCSRLQLCWPQRMIAKMGVAFSGELALCPRAGFKFDDDQVRWLPRL